jgi:hypothetical protein
MKIEQLPVGTRVYYTGDQANEPGHGVITFSGGSTGTYADQVNVLLDDGREIKGIYACGFSDVYKGGCGTRFVTESAYNAWREKVLKAFAAQLW